RREPPAVEGRDAAGDTDDRDRCREPAGRDERVRERRRAVRLGMAVDEAEEYRGVREREEGHEIRLQPRAAGEVAVALHRAGFYGGLDLARAEAPDGEREDPRDPRDRPHQVRAGRGRRREEWIACRGGSGVREAGDDGRGLEAPERAAPEPVGRKDELRRRPDVRDRVVRERGPDALDDAADPPDARRDDGDDADDDP